MNEPFIKYINKTLGDNTLLITCGLPGTLKTETSEKISELKGYTILRTDLIRKDLLRHEDIFDEKIASNMDKRMRIYEELFYRAERIFAEQDSLIFDATFILHSLRQRAAQIANKYGKHFVILQTSCPKQIAIARILKRSKENYESNALTEQAYLNNQKKFEPVMYSKLIQDNPGLMLTHITVDTSRDAPGDWYIIDIRQ